MSEWKNYPAREIVTDAGDQVADDTLNALRTKSTDWKGFTIHPFARGNLTASGVQYCTGINTTTAGTNYNVEVVNISPPESGNIKEMVFGLTTGINTVSNASGVVKYQWQGRNTGVSWVNLHAQVTNTPGTTELYNTVSGYFNPQTNFNQVPCELRLILECNIANEGYARTKNSSYFTVIYEPQ